MSTSVPFTASVHTLRSAATMGVVTHASHPSQSPTSSFRRLRVAPLLTRSHVSVKKGRWVRVTIRSLPATKERSVVIMAAQAPFASALATSLRAILLNEFFLEIAQRLSWELIVPCARVTGASRRSSVTSTTVGALRTPLDGHALTWYPLRRLEVSSARVSVYICTYMYIIIDYTVHLMLHVHVYIHMHNFKSSVYLHVRN